MFEPKTFKFAQNFIKKTLLFDCDRKDCLSI